MRSNRREFLQQAAGTALSLGAVGALTSVADEKKDLLPIIDCHQHLWDLTKFKPPWLKGAPEILAKSYVTKDFLAETKGLNVVKAVYMEVDVAPSQQVEEAKHVIALSKDKAHPTVAAVISGRPNSEGFKAYISQFKGSPYIKGVRQVLHVESAEPGLCLEKQFVNSMQLLGELGMSYDLCMRPTELNDGAELAKMCPDTRFIVDHCGNGDPQAFMKKEDRDQKPWHGKKKWMKSIDRLAKRKNVICKISGIVARAPKDNWKAEQLAPVINHCLDAFGPDRVVFGGDWPVCRLRATYRAWVTALKEVISERPRADQKKLLHDNAVKFYRLS